jgi:hypothetical protein
MPITITAEQRDALYDDVLTHLSGLDGLWQAINAEDYDGPTVWAVNLLTTSG